VDICWVDETIPTDAHPRDVVKTRRAGRLMRESSKPQVSDACNRVPCLTCTRRIASFRQDGHSHGRAWRAEGRKIRAAAPASSRSRRAAPPIKGRTPTVSTSQAARSRWRAEGLRRRFDLRLSAVRPSRRQRGTRPVDGNRSISSGTGAYASLKGIGAYVGIIGPSYKVPASRGLCAAGI